MPTRAQYDELALDHLATDLPYQERMLHWTVDDVVAYFDSAGAVVPDAAEHTEQMGSRRDGFPHLLCLHSSAGCGSTFRKQLAPLALEDSYDLDFLDGELEMDPAVQPEARMLRVFFPNAPNRSYMRLVELNVASGEERSVLLATNALAAGPQGMVTHGGDTSQEAGRREYRNVANALELLARRIARASLEGGRYDGVVAFSQGANLLVMALALLEAAEDAAATQEANAGAMAPGPQKVAAKAAALAASEAAARRSRLLRPPLALLFSPTDFGWTSQMASPAFAARCLAALDLGIAVAEAGLTGRSLPLSSLEAGEEPPGLVGVFGRPLTAGKTLFVLGQKDAAIQLGHVLARRFASSACAVVEHSEGHKIPSARDAAVRQKVVNFLRVGSPEEFIAGGSAWYRHRRLGWIQVRVTKVDYQGVADGGVTFCITAAELDGEVETVRERLALTRPAEAM